MPYTTKSGKKVRVSSGAKTLMNKYKSSMMKELTGKRKYARTSLKKGTVKEDRIVAKVISRVAENKIIPLTEFTEVSPVPIQIGAQGYMFAAVLGGVPTPWNSGYWNNLGSVTPPSGTGHAQRIGNQFFLKKTSLVINVDCEKRSDPLPMEFRTIVAKPRRSRDPTGVTQDPYLNLFTNPNGDPVGPGTNASGIPGQGITNPQLFNSMINLRDYMVYSDTFDNMMGSSQHNQNLGTLSTSHAPPYKGFYRKRISLPHNIKAHVNTQGRLTNYDPAYFVVILARTLGQDDAAGRWNLWVQGTTSYNDS